MSHRSAALVIGLALLAPHSAAATTQAMHTGAPAVAPSGFIYFCLNHADACAKTVPAVIELTDDKLSQLRDVQWSVNHRVAPTHEPAGVWEYPTDGKGDCNRYALAKRRQLIALGWPESALLLTAVLTSSGEGHLILTVLTTAGELVLDNLQREVVMDWRALPYRFLERQSTTDAAEWLTILSRENI